MPFALKAASDFPTGNTQVLEIRDDGAVPEVHFAAVPAGGPEAIWFHFRIEPPREDAPPVVRCVLHFFETLLGNKPGSTAEGFAPVYRTARRDWARTVKVARHEQPDGQALLSWKVPGNEGEIHVALSYPYHANEVDTLVRETAPTFAVQAIGLTPNAAPIHRLGNSPGRPGGDRPGIYCLARQHACESPGSWVLDGFLRRIAAHGDSAPLVWAVPFADTDGVTAGRPGKDSFPWDFNRAWGSKLFGREKLAEYGSHPMRHEVKCLQHDLLRWRSRCRAGLVLDFHAPVACQSNGIFVYLRDFQDGKPDASHAPWVHAIESALDPRYRATPFAHSGRYPSRWNTARLSDFVNEALTLPEITIEVPYSHSRETILHREDYQAAGHQIAGAVIEVIASSPALPSEA